MLDELLPLMDISDIGVTFLHRECYPVQGTDGTWWERTERTGEVLLTITRAEEYWLYCMPRDLVCFDQDCAAQRWNAASITYLQSLATRWRQEPADAYL